MFPEASARGCGLMDARDKNYRISAFRFLAWAAAVMMEAFRPGFPKVVRIETTNLCNARCTFCPHAYMVRKKGVMPQELFEKIVTECAEGGCKVLHLHNFGEPLMDRQLPQRIQFAKEKGIGFVKIFSNGSLLCNGAAEGLLNCGLDEIKISVDGADAAEFNELRRGLDYGRTVENVKRFRRMRDLNGLKHPIITATCVQTSSRKRTREVLREVVDRVIFADLHNWGGAGRLLGTRRIRQPCSRLWQTFTVLVGGEVALCCMDYEGGVILGHCGQQNIAEIWMDHPYREVRKLHRESEQHRIQLCKECSMSFFQPTLSSYKRDG